MSYKEWEAARRFEQELEKAKIEWEHAQDVAKADLKRAKKQLKALKARRGQMFVPDKPIRYTVEVMLIVRLLADWPGEVGFSMKLTIEGVMSETQAEVQAIGKLKELGYAYVGTAGTKLVKS